MLCICCKSESVSIQATDQYDSAHTERENGDGRTTRNRYKYHSGKGRESKDRGKGRTIDMGHAQRITIHLPFGTSKDEHKRQAALSTTSAFPSNPYFRRDNAKNAEAAKNRLEGSLLSS